MAVRRIDLDHFRREYPRAVRDVARFVTPERQQLIARHNQGLEPARTNLTNYLEASGKRYLKALSLFNMHLPLTGEDIRALDVGGFLGAYPLTLARLGISVTLAEVFAYYGGALDDLSHFLASEGVEIWDADFTQRLERPPGRRFAMVTNMAMLEHLAGSPEQLMRNLHSATDRAGALVMEVPNIAYWPNRINLMRGRSVHPPLEVVFGSATPFLGHHREYTVAELRALLEWTGFRTVAVEQFNYSIALGEEKWARRLDLLLHFGLHLGPILLVRNCRELIMAVAVPKQQT